MPYTIRVQLYRGEVLEADTDPDEPPGAPGAEIVEDLVASQRALVELCEAFHAATPFDTATSGPGVWLLGFEDIAMSSYLEMLRRRASETVPFSYRQGYTVLVDTPQLRSATWWRAQVDIGVAG